jgi:RimJ/RimL family protein N-acetyltransferase
MTARQSSLGALTIERAPPDELSLVMEIIDEAAAWLHARGITEQWSSPMSQAAWDRMASRIADGNVFLARLPDGQAIGTLRFDWRDDELWRDDPEGGGYVHSFAIRNGARGHGVGAVMIE